jgi:hypothetical protein
MENYYLKNNYLNDRNKCVAKAKLYDLQADYFAKQRKNQVEEPRIFAVVRGRKGKDNGVKSGKKTTSLHRVFKKTLIVF